MRGQARPEIARTPVNLRKRNFLLWLPVLTLLFAALPATAAPLEPLDETFQQTYPLRTNGTVTLVNVNGSVRIEGWDKNAVEVQAVKRTTKESRDLQRVRIAVDALPHAVNIRTRYPEDDPAGVEVEYRLRVPYQVHLARVETVNGNIVVKGVEGAAEMRTVNGNVDVYDGGGRFSGRTTNGDVRVELRNLSPAGLMTLESINGAVILAIPQDASALLDVRSINGEFHTELPMSMHGAFGREFRGNLGRGGMTVRLRTVNGAIDIVTLRAVV